MEALTSYQNQLVQASLAEIRAAKDIDELTDIGVDIFLSDQKWWKNGCRQQFASTRNELRDGGRERIMFIVDAHNWIYADWNVNPEKDGAIKLFQDRIHSFRLKHNPALIAVAFDHGGKNFRHALDKNYKSTRSEVDPDLLRQKQVIFNWCVEQGYQPISMEGYEADDIIASLSFRAVVRGEKVIIATNDRDARQLINEKTILWAKGEWMTASLLDEKMGITPQQVVDYLVMIGKDDIKGVTNIGPKTASRLLANYGDFLHIADAPVNKSTGLTQLHKDAILEFEPRYMTCRRIHSLQRGLTLTFDWNKLHAAG